MSSSSSSSSGYCQYPEFIGNASPYLSNWHLEGIPKDTLVIYVKTVYLSTTNKQQVELYADESYYSLMAVGQVSSLSPATISITGVDDYDITGSVVWDGTILNYSYSGILYCEDFSSSSSSSSKDSSSSSSTSSSSDSSSSSQCCTSVYCEGVICSYFSAWSFSGMADKNTTNCSLYIGFDIVGSSQQIRVYKDPEFINLVAIGEISGAGTITLIQQNGSGLSGTVNYDGTPIDYPNILLVSCNTFSSSSSSSSSSIDSSSSSSENYSESTMSSSLSSSSSSIDSSSSSSSENYSESSLSSVSESTASSSSTSSSSSSSSIDSSSSSSESYLNFSSSSSSSGIFWNQAKPLVLGLSSAANTSIKNRIAQTFYVYQSTYSIGKIYCYLFKSRGRFDSYSINLSIYNCYDNGKPKDELYTSSILASTVIKDDWYAFEFNQENITTPDNGYFSVVMDHGGSEDNFVLWGYAEKPEDSLSIAWTSNNASTWVELNGYIMGMRIIGDFNAFVEEDSTIVTPPPATEITILDEITEGEIDYKNLICSFVVDSSGSMGTADRFNNRSDLISCLISKFRENYPSDIKFDMFTFGGSEVDVTEFDAGIGTFSTINLDLTNPDRTTFTFTVSGSSANIDAVYENNGNNFTVRYRLSTDQTRLICFGQGLPIDAGVLTKVSGTGDSTISFSSFKYASVSDPMIAYGFKKLKNNTTYNIGALKIDYTVVSEVNLNNFQLFKPISESASAIIGENGPNDTQTIDISATKNLITRKLFSTLVLEKSNLTSILYVGGDTVTVVDSSLFEVGEYIDILDGNGINVAREITTISDNDITFYPAAEYSVSNNSISGGIVQKSSKTKTKTITGKSANILVRNTVSSEKIVFYLQTVDGLLMEWDFSPYTSWISYNLFFFGETASLPMRFFETNGTPLPDGTEVNLSVDKAPDLTTKNEIASVGVFRASSTGDTIIYVYSIDDYYKDLVIDITDKLGNVQTTTITEVGTDTYGPYVEIADPLLFDISLEDGTTIRPNKTTSSKSLPTDNILSVELPFVDVTPIVNNKSLSISALKPYDIDRVPPSTSYDDLNIDNTYIQRQVIDSPTIDGNVVIRVLPIVEDILETISKKESDLNRIQVLSEKLDIVPQLERNVGDIQKVETITQATTSTDVSVIDYVIQTPVFTEDGLAVSSMQSFATKYNTVSLPGITVSGVNSPLIFAKQYKIYASADFLSESGKPLAKMYLEPFDIYFVTPIVISSKFIEDSTVKYYLTDPESESCFPTPEEKFVRGVYASDENGDITLNYNIAERFLIPENKTIKITIYTNRIDDLEVIAAQIVSKPTIISQQFVNIRPLSSISVVDGEQILSSSTDIDKWRDIVKNNPFENIIDSINQNDSSDLQDQVTVSNISDNIINQYMSVLNAELSTESTESSDIFYKNPEKWTLAKQYPKYEFTLPIVNGKASITIPNSEIVSLLMVEASVSFGTGDIHEQILTDAFLVSNPITISSISPLSLSPAENELYEIGANIEYFGGAQTIEDNTQVNFSFKYDEDERFTVEPNTSVTNNGWAGGIFIGPLQPIETATTSAGQDEKCPPIKKVQVSVEVFHSSGYSSKISRSILLYGRTESQDERDNFYFFAPDASSENWADGTVLDNVKIVANLNDAFNPTDLWIGEDGVERLQGFDQPNNLPRPVSIIGASPSKATWINGKIEISPKSFNKNIGHKPPTDLENPTVEPWDSPVNAVTSYRKEDGSFRRGELASGTPTPTLLGGLTVPKPIFTYSEPLSISSSLETSYTRDGLTSATIISEAKWKGKKITNKFIANEGTEFETTINFGYPIITFESGICGLPNDKGDGVPVDSRNTASGCLSIAPHSDISLSDYSVRSGLFRTDIHDDGLGNIHTHACVVDDNGVGTTVSTITLSGVVLNHTHLIEDYYALEATGHEHDLRCVAITTLLPTTNIDTDFVINSKVIYDPTNCLPYGNEPANPSGNRMMFTTLTIGAGSELPRKLVSKIEMGSNLATGNPIFILDYDGEDTEVNADNASAVATFYTAKDIEETIKGFDIKVSVKFAEYSYIDEVGDTIVVPEEIVEDGSRVTIEITPYKPLGQTDLEYLILGTGLNREYMSLLVKTSASCDGYITTRQFKVNIVSLYQWYPSIKHVTPDLINDDIYINSAINSIGFFGASQIHDAVNSAAQQIIQYQTDDEDYKDYKKIIFLLTDGDENVSEKSLNQAVSTVNFIDGEQNVQIIPVQLGQSHPSDEVLLKKYAEKTNSSVYYLNNSSESEISELCDTLTGGTTLQVNSYIISGSIVLEDPNIPSQTFLSGIDVPTGAEVTYRIRTSLDNIVFSDWTNYVDYTVPIDFQQEIGAEIKYLQYEIKLTGNESFETPTVTGGFNLNYYNTRSFYIFFQPVSVELDDDEYISSIHITSESDVPETSTVQFLFTQTDSLKPEEYYSVIEDQETILPTRFNELLITKDYKTYKAINGRWHDGATISIWKIGKGETNGVLIDPSEYSYNSINGTVTFLTYLNPNDSIFIDIYFKSSFRVAVKVNNYGNDSVVIHHVGIMYNISKRVPKDINGNIINSPINKRI